MPPIFSLKGYAKADAFDSIQSKWQATTLFIVLTALFFSLFYWLVEHILPILSFRSQLAKWVFLVIFTFIYHLIVKVLRKSSSLFFILLLFVPLFLLDIFFAGNFPNEEGKTALWSYHSDSFLMNISSIPLRLIVWNLITAICLGPLTLWLTRLVASIFAKSEKIDPSLPTAQQLFQEKWIENPIPEDNEARKKIKPARNWDFYFLKGVGLVYLFYLVILWVGWLSFGKNGQNLWPTAIQKLFAGSFQNPIHGLNFMGKMVLMSLLGLLAAYNKPLRWYATLTLFVGHLISTILIAIFYFWVETTPQKEMLLPAGILDIVLSILFLIILFLPRVRNYDSNKVFQPIKGLPLTYSIPYWFSTIFFHVLGVAFSAYFGWLLLVRFGNLSDELKTLWYAEDFIAYNSITYSGTLALLAFLSARSERLKHFLVSTIINPLSFSLFFGFIWFIFTPLPAGVYDRYFLFFFLLQALIIAFIHIFRKLRYNMDFQIIALHPSEAMTAEAVIQSLYDSKPVDSKGSLKALDNYISNIRGRKRGIVNFPFWILENLLSPLWGFRPYFSLMDSEERTYFLKKKVLRLPLQRKKAFSPPLAEVAFKIGISIKALATFAHFSTEQGQLNASYNSPENRKRLQKQGVYHPEHARLAPTSPPKDSYFAIEKQFQKEQNQYANTSENGISLPKEEYDYVLIGSGAAGGVMAYRLACALQEDASKVLLIERGKRHSAANSMTDNELEMFSKLYKEGGLQQTKNFDMTVLQAECLGGTTVVNNAVCFETPDPIIKKWTQEYGLNLADLKTEMEKIGREINIHPINQNAVNQTVKQCFFEGVQKYNALDGVVKLAIEEAVKVNAIDELGDGLWNLGNKRRRKLSMAQTYLKWAESKGMHILEETNAIRFFSDADQKSTAPFKATEVLICTKGKEFKRIKIKKKLIIAGGCLASSHFLIRSDIKQNVGHQMSCNYALSFAFKYANKIEAFDGAQITAAAIRKQQAGDGIGKDLIFETYFNPPASFALTLPFHFEKTQEIMGDYPYYLNFGILVGSENSGQVLPKANILDGRAFEWPLDPKDVEPLREAFRILLEIGRHSGAKSVVIPLQPGLRIDLEKEGEIEEFLELWKTYPLTKLDVNLNTSHPQGGNLMAGSNSKHKKDRVLDENFRLENHSNVFVVDASIFPTSLGVNPQWTVMGMSSLASKIILKE